MSFKSVPAFVVVVVAVVKVSFNVEEVKLWSEVVVTVGVVVKLLLYVVVVVVGTFGKIAPLMGLTFDFDSLPPFPST